MICICVQEGGRTRGTRDLAFDFSVKDTDKLIGQGQSHQPFLDGCRQALAAGVPPKTDATMVWMPSGRESLRGKVGVAAGLAVDEDAKGIRFRPFRERFPEG